MKKENEKKLTVKELRAAFLKYAEHKNLCHPRSPIGCKCGFIQLRRRVLRESY